MRIIREGQRIDVRPVIGMLLLAMAFVPAQASDGKIEINQVCAIAGTCLAGDTPGFPVSLGAAAEGESFILTGGLTVPAGSNGIRVDAGRVELDLNGFTIQGGGDSIGIIMAGDGVKVRNGFVRSFDVGIGLDNLPSNIRPAGVVVTNMRLTSNDVGLNLNNNFTSGGTGQLVRDSIIESNRTGASLGIGIRAVDGTDVQISNCTISHNLTGVLAQGAATVVSLVDSHISANATASVTVTAGATFVSSGGNMCGTNTTCP